MAFIENNGNVSIKRKPQAILPFEDGTKLGTLDYLDVHGAKVLGTAMKSNCTNTEILCNHYDAFNEEKYSSTFMLFASKTTQVVYVV